MMCTYRMKNDIFYLFIFLSNKRVFLSVLAGGRQQSRVNEVPVKDLWNVKLAPGLFLSARPNCTVATITSSLKGGKISTPGHCHTDGAPFMIYSLLITHMRVCLCTAQHWLRPSPRLFVQLSLQLRWQTIIRFSHQDTSAGESGGRGRHEGSQWVWHAEGENGTQP